MSGLYLEIGIADLKATLGRMSAWMAGQGQELFLADVGDYLLISHRRRFDAEQSPEGEAWTALSPRYQRRKERERPGTRKLVYDNFLKGTLTYQVNRNELLFGSNRPYAAIQHFGGKPGRKGGAGKGAQAAALPNAGGGIPARPWLGTSGADLREITELARDALARVAKGG